MSKQTGWPTLCPYLCVSDAVAAIEFYKKAFGAEERARAPAPDGKRVMHSELVIGDSVLCVVDEFPEMGGGKSAKGLGGTPVTLQLTVPDCDAIYERAVKAGATGTMPPADMFWGDRYAQLADPFGNRWAISQKKEALSPEQLERRQKEWAASMPKAKG